MMSERCSARWTVAFALAEGPIVGPMMAATPTATQAPRTIRRCRSTGTGFDGARVCVRITAIRRSQLLRHGPNRYTIVTLPYSCSLHVPPATSGHDQTTGGTPLKKRTIAGLDTTAALAVGVSGTTAYAETMGVGEHWPDRRCSVDGREIGGAAIAPVR